MFDFDSLARSCELYCRELALRVPVEGAIELLRRAWHEQTLYRGLGAGLLAGTCLAKLYKCLLFGHRGAKVCLP